MGNKEILLNNIGMVDFTMVELGLYLDTHPRDRKALEYYKHYSRIKKQLEKEFANHYYPLTAEEGECEKEWSWGAAPAPWEGVCD